MSKTKQAVIEQEEEFLASLPIVGNQPISEKEEKHLKEICEYQFFNLEESGMELTFPYGDTNKYCNFTFLHGSKYRVPRHVAQHVESCSTPIWNWRPDGTGRMVKQKTGDTLRFQMRHVFAN